MPWTAIVVLILILCAYQYYVYNKNKAREQRKKREKSEAEEMIAKMPDVRVRVFEGRWDVRKVRSRPNCLFVFGDNEDGVGRGGQAIIRDEPNAVGVPTKLRPYMNEDSFYSDEEIEDNKSAIDEAFNEIKMKLERKNAKGKKYNCLMFSENGLGTGRSQLPKRAPRTYEYLLSCIFEIARELDPDGAESTSPTAWGPWIKFLYQNTQYESNKKQRIGVR